MFKQEVLMKKILAIGASNSKKSINKKFATYVAHKIEEATVTVADLNDLELPLYSPDLQVATGIPENAHRFSALIEDSDGIVLSLAEYNGLMTTAFKNLWDWTSRIDMKIWKGKPILLMAASPGGRGGANALRVTKGLLPHFGGNVTADFSLPAFHQNFQNGTLINKELAIDLAEKIAAFQQAI